MILHASILSISIFKNINHFKLFSYKYGQTKTNYKKMEGYA